MVGRLPVGSSEACLAALPANGVLIPTHHLFTVALVFPLLVRFAAGGLSGAAFEMLGADVVYERATATSVLLPHVALSPPSQFNCKLAALSLLCHLPRCVCRNCAPFG